MSFNQFLQANKTVQNHEGAASFRMTPEMELYTSVCSMSLQPKFYETPLEQVNRVSQLVSKVDPVFVAKLAVYARREMYLRSVPLLLLVELAKVHNGDDLVSRAVEKVVMRADEIAELLMCYQWRNSQVLAENGECSAGSCKCCDSSAPSADKAEHGAAAAPQKKLARLSHQIQVGLQKAFNKFDEHQFAKYDRDGNEVKLRDALFLVHPKAKGEAQQEIFNKIANKSLSVPYTWETELSALGQQVFDSDEARQQAFKEKWTELIESGKLSYMALLRNLRNILEAGIDDEVLKSVAERICNADEVKRSKQFPFRFLSAYKELKNVTSLQTSQLLTALENAVGVSAANIQGFASDSKILLACDMSGSMEQSLSTRSKVMLYEVGNMLAMILKSRCDKLISGIFGDEWKVLNLPQNQILSNTIEIGNRIGEVGYGTNGMKPLAWLLQEKVVVDKVFFFTDCQFWDCGCRRSTFFLLWEEYKKISPDAHLYCIDLAGYGHAPIELRRSDVTLVSGWNERVFEMLANIENSQGTTERIMETEL
ncbi:MAG: TROVE domain-containing protein [Alloprevotella sp.]